MLEPYPRSGSGSATNGTPGDSGLTLLIGEIVHTITTEVIAMTEIHESGLSSGLRESRERGSIREERKIPEETRKCFTRCVDDSWDMKSEKLCAEACGM
jgi:hypothetical protein